MHDRDPTSPGGVASHGRVSALLPSTPRTISRNIAAGSAGVTMDAETRTGLRVVLVVAVVVLTVGVAAVWSIVVQRQLAASIEAETTHHLDRAQHVFELVRAHMQDDLRAQCRVLVEDPRLKSTLATEGIDEATVADILGDLRELRRTGFLIVLSPEGRVFAQAGAEELRGLDLSDSSVVKLARSSQDAVVGSWVIGGNVRDLSITAVRFGRSLLAYLVVGQAIDQELVKEVAERTGVGIATAAGNRIVLASSADEDLQAVFAAVAARAGTGRGRVVEVRGTPYVTAVSQLEQTTPSEQRLVLVQSPAGTSASFRTLKWMIFVPPILVLIAVLFAMTASRRTIILTRPRRLS